jgi:serine/threonine-protein kinase
MIGKTVGKYRIVERLGRGGMGTVYKAVDETLEREVAIKVLNGDFGDSAILKRFRAEAVTLARLNHPNIATLFELYRDNDELLMVMEFVRGETVHALAERLGPLAAPQAAHLVMQVLDALAHAHRAGVVHRDLKPANLMITAHGSVKVMDFGIARVLGTEHVTQGGYMLGTPAYMAPEQVLGNDIDGRADLYAVGVVLYRLLSGQLPFSADTAIAMVQKQVNDSPIPIARFQPDLPPWCARVLQRALAKAPADRFQTADDFRAALLDAVQPQGLGEMATMAARTLPTSVRGSDATRAQAAPTTSRTAAALATPPPAAVGEATPAVATPVTRPLELSKTTTTVVLGRRHLVGMGALAAALVAAMGVLGYFAMRRSPFPEQLQLGAPAIESSAPASGTAAPGQAADGAPTVAQAAPPPPPQPPGPPKLGPVQAAGRAGRAGSGAEGALPPAPAVAATADAPVSAPEVEPAVPAAPLPPAAAAVTFRDVRLLVKDGTRSREQNGVLSLDGGQLSVLDKTGGTALVSLPYSSLTGAAYSRSKQPRWTDAEGKAVEAKADLGKLGFLRSERNWLILFSQGEPVIIRLEDGGLRSILPAVETHTGVKIRR